MINAQRWWSESGAQARKTPEYKAEALAIDVAIQVSNRLKALSLSKKQLSERLRVSKAYVSQLMQGKSNMTLLTLCRVADAIDFELFVGMRPRRAVSYGVRAPEGIRITSAVSSVHELGTLAAYSGQTLVGTNTLVGIGTASPGLFPPQSGVVEEEMYGRVW
jgi:transcriptional regulator with XRE-family HTH domain